MKYQFTASIVVEASSEEDALSNISSRIATISRHLGNGETLADNEPFFSLDPVDDGAPVNLQYDPIRAAQVAVEGKEEGDPK